MIVILRKSLSFGCSRANTNEIPTLLKWRLCYVSSCESPMLILCIYIGWLLCAVSNDSNIQCSGISHGTNEIVVNGIYWRSHSLLRSHHLSLHFCFESNVCHFFIYHNEMFFMCLECAVDMHMRVCQRSKLKWFASAHSHKLTSLFHFIVSCPLLLATMYWFSVSSFLSASILALGMCNWMRCTSLSRLMFCYLMPQMLFGYLFWPRAQHDKHGNYLHCLLIWNLADAFISIPLLFNRVAHKRILAFVQFLAAHVKREN